MLFQPPKCDLLRRMLPAIMASAAGMAAAQNVNLDNVGASEQGFYTNSIGMYVQKGLAAGDFNGDGMQDTAFSTEDGRVYVIFGKTTLTSTAVGSGAAGTSGYGISGFATPDLTVSTVGDVNGDGLDDLAVGAPGADNWATDGGIAYIIWGKATTTNLDITAMPTNSGFGVYSSSAGDLLGTSIVPAGYYNGDALADFYIGVPGSDAGQTNGGRIWRLYGQTMVSSGFNLYEVSTIATNITTGSTSQALGTYMAGIGDVNGDGLDDMAYGIPTGGTAGQVIVGITGGSFYTISGIDAGDDASRVSAAGDANGDGYDDVLIVAPGGDPSSRTNAGEAYVVFGKSSWASIALSSLGTGGFRIDGSSATSPLHAAVGVGDVNGDSYGDLLISNPGLSLRWIVYGKTSTTAVDLASLGTGGHSITNGGTQGKEITGSGDINADGKPDYAITSAATTNRVYYVFGQTALGTTSAYKEWASNSNALPRAFGTVGNYTDFSSPGARFWLDYSTGVGPTMHTVTITRNNSSITNLADTANVMWRVEGARSGSATMKLRYLASEIATLQEPTLQLWTAAATSGPWTQVTSGFSLNQSKNEISATYPGLGYFAIKGTLIDVIPPTVTIGAIASPTNLTFFNDLPITFSETVTGLAVGDFTVSGVTISDLKGSGANYTVDVTLSGLDGTKSFFLAASAVLDGNNNANAVSATRSVVLERVVPTVSIAAAPTFTNQAFRDNLAITFSEAVTGLILADFSTSGITLSDLQGSGANYTVDVTLTGADGAKSFSLPATRVIDTAGNANSASNTYSTTFDTVAPISSCSIALTETNNATISLPFTASDTLSGVASTQLYVKTPGSGSFVSTGSPLTGTSGTFIYTASAGDGIYEFHTRSTDNGGAVELAPASADDSIRLDQTPPVAGFVAVTPDPRFIEVGEVTINFPEPVTGFDIADLTLVCDASPIDISGLTLNGSGASYSIDLSSVSDPDGLYTLTVVAAGSGIHDSTNNFAAVNSAETWRMNLSPPVPTIAEILPDPRETDAGVVAINWDEVVTGFDNADLTLYRDEAPIDITALPLVGSGANYTIDLTSVTFIEGVYELRLTIAGSGIVNDADIAAVEGSADMWLRRSPGPVALIDPVLPNPRNNAAGTINVTFSRAVDGIDLDDFVLYRDGVTTPLTGVILSGSGLAYALNLTAATAESGTYRLNLPHEVSGIADPNGILLTNTDEITWLTEMTPPVPTFPEVPLNPRGVLVNALDLNFSEPVTGVGIDDFSLTLNGSPVALTGCSVSGSGATYVVDLTPVTGSTPAFDGTYILTLNVAGANIRDTADNLMVAGASVSWLSDFTNPVGSIAPISPNLRSTPVGNITITFSEPVVGIDSSDFTLTRNGTPIVVSDLVVAGSGNSYTLNLTSKTSGTGAYVVSMNASGSGIQDLVGNPLVLNASRTWTGDFDAPTADVVDVTPDFKPMNAGVVTVNFNEPVTGVTPARFGLTRNGSPVSLATLAVSGSGTQYNVDLTAISALDGNFVLTVNPAGILDAAGNTLAGSASDAFEVRRTLTIGSLTFAPKNFTYSGSDYTFTTPVEINGRAFYASSGTMAAVGTNITGDGRVMVENVGAQGNLTLVNGAYTIEATTGKLSVDTPTTAANLVVSGMPMFVCSATFTGNDAKVNGWFDHSKMANTALHGLLIKSGPGSRSVTTAPDATLYGALNNAARCDPSLDDGKFAMPVSITFGASSLTLKNLSQSMSGTASQLSISSLLLDSSPLTSTASGSITSSAGTWSFSNQGFETGPLYLTAGQASAARHGKTLIAPNVGVAPSGIMSMGTIQPFSFGSLTVTPHSSFISGSTLYLSGATVGGTRPATMTIEITPSGFESNNRELSISTARFEYGSASFSDSQSRVTFNNAKVYAGPTLQWLPISNLTLAQSNATFSGLSFSMAGFPFAIPATSQASQWDVTLNMIGPYVMGSPTLAIGTRALTDSGLDISIDKCLSDTLYPRGFGFSLKELCIKFRDYPTQEFFGKMSIDKSWGMKLDGSMAMRDNKLTMLEFDASNLNKPIGTTGAELERIKGGFFNLAGDTTYVCFAGDCFYSYGSPYFKGRAEFENTGPSDIWNGNVDAMVDGGGARADGDLYMFSNYKLGSANLVVKWDSQFYARVKGNYKLGPTRHDGSMQVERRPSGSIRYAGSYTSGVEIPKWVPFVGGDTVGGLEAGIGGEDTYFWISLRKCFWLLVGDVCIKVKIDSDGDVDISTKQLAERKGLLAWEQPLNPKFVVQDNKLVRLSAVNKSTLKPNTPVLTFGENLRSVSKQYFKARPSNLKSSFTQNVTLAPNAVSFVRVTYELATGDPTFNLTAPDTTVYTPAAHPFSDSPASGVMYRHNADLHEAAWWVGSVTGGTYTVEILNPSTLGAFAIEVVQPLEDPTFAFNNVALVADQIIVDYTVNAPSGTATLDFFLDNNPKGTDGTILEPPGGTQLTANGVVSNVVSFDLSSKPLPPGRHWVYAVVYDGVTNAQFVYAPVPVYIPDPMAPPLVENFDIAQAGTSAFVSWDLPTTDTLLVRWNLYATDDPIDGEPQYLGSTSPDNLVALFHNFQLNKTYKFLLTATREYVVTIGTKSAQMKRLQSVADQLAAGRKDSRATKDEALALVRAVFGGKSAANAGVSLESLAQQAVRMAELNAVKTKGASADFLAAVDSARQLHATNKDGGTTVTLYSESEPTAYEVVHFGPIAGVNSAPVITSESPSTVQVGTTLNYQVVATDPEGDPMTYHLLEGPIGLTMSPTGLVQWTPSAVTLYQDVVIEVRDNQGGVASHEFQVAGSSLPAPPSFRFTSYPDTTPAASFAWSYTPTLATINASPVTFTLIAGPVGMTINATNGALAWTTPAVSGNHNVELLARQTVNGTTWNAYQAFTIEVAPAPDSGLLSFPGITPNDLVLVETGGSTDVRETLVTDTYTITVADDVTDVVHVIATPPANIDLGEGPGQPLFLAFGAGQPAGTSYTVNVSAIDDGAYHATSNATIVHQVISGHPSFLNVTVPNVVVTVQDVSSAVSDWQMLD